jgi:hypothetical protein
MKSSIKLVAGAVAPHPSNTTLRKKIQFRSRRGLRMTTATLLGALVAFLFLAPSAFAQISGAISVQMTFPAGYGTPLFVEPTDVAGAVPVTNWNDYMADTSWPSTQGTNNLLDSTGANTGAGLSMSGVNNGWYNGGAVNSASTPDAKLLNCLLVLRSGGTDTFTFTNLPAIGKYDLYIYLSGQDNDDQVSVQCTNNGVTYYQETPPGLPVTNNQVLVQGANTTSGIYPGCNYVVFSGVTPAANAISFVVAPSPSSDDNGGVSGVQLVPAGAGPTYLSILQQPQPADILSGSNATFTVTAAGNPVVTSYQWYEISGTTTNSITGANTNGYTVTGATANGTSYFVVVGNGITTVTSSAAPLNITYSISGAIGVQMTFPAGYGTPLFLAPTDVAGAVPLGNWNDYVADTSWPSTQGTNNLVDSTGTNNTGAGLYFNADNGWYNGGAVNSASTPDAKLLNCLLVLRSGDVDTFTFTNLPAIGKYDLYVYLSGQDNDDQVSVQCTNNGVTYYQEAPPGLPVTNNQVLVEGANTTSGTYPGCNYVVFRGLTPATLGSDLNAISFVVTPSPSSGDNGGVSGVQLVPAGAGPTYLSILQQAQPAYILSGQNATFTVNAGGNPAITSYQWYQISGGVTNSIPGATSSSYTVLGDTATGTSYFVVIGNGSTTVTSSVVPLNITVAQPAISMQLTVSYFAGTLLAPTDVAGVVPMSNWNVLDANPGAGTIPGLSSASLVPYLVDSNGAGTPVVVTAYDVCDGWHEADTITAADTANARFMNTYWYANPIDGRGGANYITFNVTNLPNGIYDVYVYLLQQVSSGNGGPVEVFDGTTTNYGEYSQTFTSLSNFVTAIDTAGTGLLPYVNYIELQISTGGTNSLEFTESGVPFNPTGGTGGAGVTGIQIVPVPTAAPTIVTQPLSQRVITNLTATFSAVADGYPLAYQWYSISRAGVTNALANATNFSYTTPPVLDSISGTGFFVVVTNFLGYVQSSTAYLTAGHMVTASGLTIDNQFLNGAGTPPYVFISMYPDSSWFATNPPTLTEYLNTFESSNDLPVLPPPFVHQEAEQIHGWFTPAVSGDYVFFVTSDDAGTLWLSTNNNPTNSYLIAQNQAWMTDRDWTCTNTACGEYTGGYSADGEFRSDLFISGGGQEAYNDYYAAWAATPNFNTSDSGIPLVAGTPYYIELDNYYSGLPPLNGGSPNQCAAVTYKLASQPDPVSGSAPLLASNSISASVPDSVPPAPTPVITTMAIAAFGSQVIINADNGLVNAQCNVQTSTNLTQWVTSASGWFDLSGNFSITNAIATNAPQTFYRLQEVPK